MPRLPSDIPYKSLSAVESPCCPGHYLHADPKPGKYKPFYCPGCKRKRYSFTYVMERQPV